MIGGVNERKADKYVSYTGLAVIRPIIVNPSNEEYREITGSSLPYDLNYDKIELNQGEKQISARPLKILCHIPEIDRYELMNLYVSLEEVLSKNGKKKFIDHKGRISYFVENPSDVKDNFRFDADNCEPLCLGMEEIHKLLQMLLKYSAESESANWLEDVRRNDITAEDLYNNNVEGLNKTLRWAIENHFALTTLLSVKEKEKEQDDGSVKTYIIQILERKPDLFFLADEGEEEGQFIVPNYAYKKLKDMHTSQVEKGYSATKNLFTYKLQAFNKENCVNAEETTPPEDEGIPSTTPSTDGWV